MQCQWWYKILNASGYNSTNLNGNSHNGAQDKDHSVKLTAETLKSLNVENILIDDDNSSSDDSFFSERRKRGKRKKK